MSALLYLVHRIPFPPNKGDKIRSFHLLEALRTRYELYVGTFIDAEEDRQYLPALRGLCTESFVAQLHPRWRRLTAGRGLLANQPLTNAYYGDRALTDWVERTIATRRIERVVVFSSSMGQFISPAAAQRLRCVIDFCDIDSDKWRQYAQRHSWPLSAVFAREARLLERAEVELARRFTASLFVSGQEAATFRKLVPEAAGRIHAVRNGVDASYFDPEKSSDPDSAAAGPAPRAMRPVVFTGAMDYWANVEGVTWFAQNVWPAVRARHPDATFMIVGARPTRAVLQLASVPGVVVTGAVPDVRPYLRMAHVAIAPLRIARGVQNKVLEAMSMGRHVVATPPAVQGIDVTLPPDVQVTETPVAFAAAVGALLEPAAPRLSRANREFVLEHYDWARNLSGFLELVAGEGPAESSVAAA